MAYTNIEGVALLFAGTAIERRAVIAEHFVLFRSDTTYMNTG